MIGGLIAIGLVIGLIVAASAFESSMARGRRAAWAKAAEKLGLTLSEDRGFDLALHGRIDELFVEVRYRTGRKQAASTRFTVRGERALGFALEMHVKDLILKSEPGLPIDHGKFDAKFRVLGVPDRVYGALSSSVRARLLQLGDANIYETDLSHSSSGSPLGPELISTVRNLCALYKELDVPAKRTDTQLFEAFEAERDPIVARHQMEAFFDRPVVRRAYDRAVALGLAHRDREVRLIASRAGGTRAIEVLREIASDPHAADALRARALAASPERAFALESLLELREVAAPKLRAAIAERIGELRDGAIERALIESLADEANEVRDAAARSLGAIGTLASVEALRAADSVAAAEAVRAIQARAGGSGPGGLAIVGEDDRGAVSLSADPGALSVKSDD